MGFESRALTRLAGREADHLRIDRTEHREFAQHDLVSGESVKSSCPRRSS